MGEKKSLHKKLIELQQRAKEKFAQEENTQKISSIKFYKKVWYSLSKPEKYLEMSKEGTKYSNRYLFGLIAIFAIIISLISTFEYEKICSEGIKYINDNLPEMAYTEEKLSTETEGIYTLEDTFLSTLIGNLVVIDTKPEYTEDIIVELKTKFNDDKTGIILLNDKIITIGLSEEETEYTYPELLKLYADYNGSEEILKEFTKTDIMTFINSIPLSFGNYISQYFIAGFIEFTIIFMLFAITLSIIGFIISKIIKVKVKLGESYSMAIYSYTLTICIYLIYMIGLYFMSSIKLGIINTIIAICLFIVIPLIYLILSFIKIKKEQKGEKINA